jgi:hypothetical protein
MNRRLYRGTVLHCRGSHTPGGLNDPIFTAYRVPCPSDVPGDPYAYREPKHGDYTVNSREYARRLRLYRSRRFTAPIARASSPPAPEGPHQTDATATTEQDDAAIDDDALTAAVPDNAAYGCPSPIPRHLGYESDDDQDTVVNRSAASEEVFQDAEP